MMKRKFLVLTLSAMVSAGYTQSRRVIIETTFGDVVVELYDDTPLHRDNFIKLVESGFYDELIFHRVINEFMIQGGDPESKGAPAEKHLGQGGPGYTIDAEIVYPKYFHKKGVLAAARTGDQVNPERKSSGSQFYIVQGKVYSEEEVDMLEQNAAQRTAQAIVNRFAQPHIETFVKLQAAGDAEGMQNLQAQIMQEAATELEAARNFRLSPQIREAYTTVGGTPHLDDAYTVFGEVVEGMEVIDKIAAVETNPSNRPLTDVIMRMRVVAN